MQIRREWDNIPTTGTGCDLLILHIFWSALEARNVRCQRPVSAQSANTKSGLVGGLLHKTAHNAGKLQNIQPFTAPTTAPNNMESTIKEQEAHFNNKFKAHQNNLLKIQEQLTTLSSKMCTIMQENENLRIELSENNRMRKRKAAELEEIKAKVPKKTRVFQKIESPHGVRIQEALTKFLSIRKNLRFPDYQTMEKNKDYVFLLKRIYYDTHDYFGWVCKDSPKNAHLGSVANLVVPPYQVLDCISKAVDEKNAAEVILGYEHLLMLEMTLRRKVNENEDMVVVQSADLVDFDKNIGNIGKIIESYHDYDYYN